jgi:methionyl-tRNA formyltransferase
MTDARVLFAGTPEFALASLQALTNSAITPLAVLTQPDRPAGRGKHLTASPVKRFARDQGIEVLQPETLKDPRAVAQIAAFEPDILVVAAYGLILPQSVLDIPARGCLNVHASLLPRWRGAAPIQAAILAGDAETGISLMAMTAGLDCGPVYVEEAIAIGEEETAGERPTRERSASRMRGWTGSGGQRNCIARFALTIRCRVPSFCSTICRSSAGARGSLAALPVRRVKSCLQAATAS